jgi:hypothetical protein
MEYHPREPEPKKSKAWMRRWILFLAMRTGILLGLIADVQRDHSSPPPVAEVSVEQLSDFDLDQMSGTASDTPAKFRALDGHRITLLGWMWDPQASADGVHQFTLVNKDRSDFKQPAAQEFISCDVANPVQDSDGKVAASGTLRINVVHDPSNGQIRSVFSLDVDALTPLERPREGVSLRQKQPAVDIY